MKRNPCIKKPLLFLILLFNIALSGHSQTTCKYFKFIVLDSRFNSYQTKTKINEINSKFIDCYQISYDSKERIQRILFLKKGKPTLDEYGYCDMRFEYLDSVEKRVLYDSKGLITASKDRVSTYYYKLTDKNFRTTLINYDIEGNLIADNRGVAQYEWILDDKGRKMSEIYRNLKGEQISTLSGIYETKYKWSNDEKNYNEESYCDKNGNLIKISGSPSMYLRKYDKHRNCVEGRYLDENEHLMENRNGVAVFKNKYLNFRKYSKFLIIIKIATYLFGKVADIQ